MQALLLQTILHSMPIPFPPSEQIQNLILWSDYQRRKAKVAHAAGPHGANEQLK